MPMTKNLELHYMNRPLANLAALQAKNVTGLDDGFIVEVISMSPYGGQFYWLSTSSTVADNINVVLPTGHVGNGRWIRRDFDVALTASGKIPLSQLDIANPLIYKGQINVPADFPTLAAVQIGWLYSIGTTVTDSDPTKTHTMQVCYTGDYIIWNGTNWDINSSSVLPLTDSHIFVGSAAGIATDVAMSSEATIANTGAVTLDNGAVIGKVLTGFASGAGTVAATDTILQAFDKIDGNVAGKEPTITAGTTSQYWRGDKSWQTHDLASISDVSLAIPTIDQALVYNGVNWVNKNIPSTSAGNGVQFYLDDTTLYVINANNDDQVNTLSPYPITTTEVIDSISCASNTVLGESYLLLSDLNTTLIPAGEWLFNTYAGVSSVGGGRVSSLRINIMRVRDGQGGVGTVTVTGSGTSRTCTASGGTPFATSEIDVGGTIDSDSYILTTQGFYRITARTSDTEVTINVPSTYTNEVGATYYVCKRLFQHQTATITNLSSSSYSLYSERDVQPAYTILATDGLLVMYFGVSNNTTTVSYTHNGNSRYSNFRSTLTVAHNDLTGLYGESPYYHFNSTAHNYLYQQDQTVKTTSSPTFSNATLSSLATAGGIVQTDGTGALHTGALPTDSGLSITSYQLAMGTPSTCTGSTTNAVTTNTHTHAITGFQAAVTPSVEAFTPTLGQTAFTLAHTRNASYLFFLTLNGAIQLEGTDFTVSGTSLTWLNTGGITLKTTDSLVARYYY